jgi:exonuclease SbcC
MRPLRLTVEGFTSFRDRTEVDFSDADYFALVGPTGSGKSSLIDAIAFALYGSVPRYDDRRLVAPVITQGRVEARVGLEFAVGSERYRAVRVVRATGSKKGATTKEARLERLASPGVMAGGAPGDTDAAVETIAGDADGVTAAVTSLLGLSFEHFTKCVVLPQGAFARFLHDKPAARQDLLAGLLGLGVYAELGQRANQAAAAARNRAELASQQLARPPLDSAGAEAVARATSRADEVHALEARVRAEQPELAALADKREATAAVASAAEARAQALVAVRVPDSLDAVAADLQAAADDQRAAEAAALAAERATAEAEARLEALPPRRVLEHAAQLVEERDDLRARIDKAQRVTGEAVVAEGEVGAEMEAATSRLAAARDARDAGGHLHQAAVLTALLVPGEACPVCRQTVAALPAATSLPDLAAADGELRRAEQELTEVAAALREAGLRRAKAEEQLSVHRERLAGVDARIAELDATLGLDGRPHRTALQERLAAVDAADGGLSSARATERQSRAHARQAAEALTRAQLAGSEAWAAFDTHRDGVAALEPPPVDRADLLGAWSALVDWARARQPDEEQAASIARDEVSRLEAEERRRLSSLAGACQAAGIEVEGARSLGEVVAAALAHADAAVQREQELAAEAERVRVEAATAQADAAIAHALGQHLKSSGFEKWLLDEVQASLVAGATVLLRELSCGAYSLTLDEAAGFAVVDHRNADLLRSARTLSGGETFLASLALALALGDQLSGFAVEGAARLEAIFLDEGFGALDPDTLDIVAGAIENLAAEGRVVGLVTHVRDLADRIPVRFEVEKGPATSTVRRVEG